MGEPGETVAREETARQPLEGKDTKKDADNLVNKETWVGLSGTRQELDQKTLDLPELPGVYVFRGEGGEILYVGKARNLKKRLRSYFSSNLSPKTAVLMEKVRGLETITVDSEVEALILESNLIKKHKPPYNIRLRDDKHYPYLRVGVADKWPRVTVVRKIQKDGARYFGPFTRSGAVRETLALLRRIFPFRNCSDRVLSQTTRPCLDYHIGRCLGPCTGKVDEETYRATIADVIKFLEGRHKDVRQSLEKKMEALAENLEFEKAAKVRDQIRALDEVTVRQKIISPDMKDRDILGIARGKDYSFVALLPVREGKLIGREGFVLSGTASEEDSEVIAAFMSQYYPSASLVPPEILIPCEIPEKRGMEQFLKSRIRMPRRGPLRDLVLMANDNARTMLAEFIPKYEREAEENRKAMEDLAEALGLPRLPRRIEGYDISNTLGQEAVASMVVLSDGKPDKSSYRRFKMKIDGKPNDFAMMQEALWRRFKRGLDERARAGEEKSCKRGFGLFPDLIVVDGGKGQVNAAKEVLDQLGLDIPLAGLAKRNEEIFLPGRSDPVLLPRASGALFLMMRLRDEAHRFALSYHRNLRGKKAMESALLEIPGLGQTRATELLKSFGDLDAVRKASLEDLVKVKGIGPKLAKKIIEHLNPSSRQ